MGCFKKGSPFYFLTNFIRTPSCQCYQQKYHKAFIGCFLFCFSKIPLLLFPFFPTIPTKHLQRKYPEHLIIIILKLLFMKRKVSSSFVLKNTCSCFNNAMGFGDKIFNRKLFSKITNSIDGHDIRTGLILHAFIFYKKKALSSFLVFLIKSFGYQTGFSFINNAIIKY